MSNFTYEFGINVEAHHDWLASRIDKREAILQGGIGPHPSDIESMSEIIRALRYGLGCRLSDGEGLKRWNSMFLPKGELLSELLKYHLVRIVHCKRGLDENHRASFHCRVTARGVWLASRYSGVAVANPVGLPDDH